MGSRQTHVLVLYNVVLCYSPKYRHSCLYHWQNLVAICVFCEFYSVLEWQKGRFSRLTTRPTSSWRGTDGTSRHDRCKESLETQMCLCRVQQRIVGSNADTVTFGDIYCCSLRMKSHMLLPVIKRICWSSLRKNDWISLGEGTEEDKGHREKQVFLFRLFFSQFWL